MKNTTRVLVVTGAFLSATAQPLPKYPTIDPLTHKSCTETIERDGVKASFEMIAVE